MQTHLWLQHQSGSVAQKVIGGDSEEEGRGGGAPSIQTPSLQRLGKGV